MPRLRQVGRDEAHPFAKTVYKSLFGDRDPVVSPGTDTGTPGNWWTVFALVPDAFDHAVAGFQFYRGKRKLDPKYRELGQTRVGWARGSQFVYSQHCKASRSVGLPEEKIAAIPHWQAANCYTDIERALLAYTTRLSMTAVASQTASLRCSRRICRTKKSSNSPTPSPCTTCTP